MSFSHAVVFQKTFIGGTLEGLTIQKAVRSGVLRWLEGYGLRDSQRSRVYRAERRAWETLPPGAAPRESLTLADAEALVALALADPAVRAAYPGTSARAPKVVALRRPGRSLYTPEMVSLAPLRGEPGRFRAWIVIHELAHHLARVGAGHGGDFVEAYLVLVRRVFGAEAEARLLAHLRALRVRYTSDVERVVIDAAAREARAMLMGTSRAKLRVLARQEFGRQLAVESPDAKAVLPASVRELALRYAGR